MNKTDEQRSNEFAQIKKNYKKSEYFEWDSTQFATITHMISDANGATALAIELSTNLSSLN